MVTLTHHGLGLRECGPQGAMLPRDNVKKYCLPHLHLLGLQYSVRVSKDEGWRDGETSDLAKTLATNPLLTWATVLELPQAVL